MTAPGPHTPGSPDSPGIPPDAVARFTAAEALLYPLAAVDPIRYERAVSLTGELLEDLRQTCADIEEVLARRDALVLMLSERTDETRPGLTGLQPETLVDAASAVRCRELRAEQVAKEATLRIAAAKDTGQEWLVDEPDPAALMSGLYRRVELHVPTGAVLVSSVEAGTGDTPTEYKLELIPPRDPGGNRLPEVTETYPDQASWVRAIERRREQLSSRP